MGKISFYLMKNKKKIFYDQKLSSDLCLNGKLTWTKEYFDIIKSAFKQQSEEFEYSFCNDDEG